MSKNQKKSLVAALLMTAVVATSVPAMAAGQDRRSHEGSSVSWVVRVLGWLGLRPDGLRSVWDESRAHIDPDGRPETGGENPQGAVSPDDSAHIDPNG